MTETGKKTEQNRLKKGGLNYKSLSFFEKSPIETEQKVADSHQANIPVIPFFTSYNDFALQLAALAEAVPEHDGAIRAKRRWATAEPFTVTTANPCSILNNAPNTETEIGEAQMMALEAFVCNVNTQGENLMNVVRNVITDMETTGNAYIELIRGNAGGQSYFFIEQHDSTECLLIRRDDIITVGISADWQLAGIKDKRAPIIELPLYRGLQTKWKKLNGSERCIIHLKTYRTGRHWYGLPESISSFLAQKIGFEINRHNLDRLETDFFPRLFFEFFGVDGMDDEAQTEHLKALEKTFTKKGKTKHGIFAQYNETEQSNMKIHKLELDHSGDYIKLSDEARQQILIAHATPSIIAGVQTQGKIGSSAEVSETFTLFNNTVIIPMQRFLTERFITPILQESSAWLGGFEGLFLEMNISMPVSFMGTIQVNRVLTVNEGRAQLGFGELMDNVDGENVRSETGDELIITTIQQDEQPN